jgi:cellulose biosynthesis protein BcsQ
MAQIHFIGGEKGGVGKSLVARLLAQYLIDHERPFLGFDTDKSHGALMRFYAGYASPVVVDRYESLDAIVEAAVAVPGRSILVDMAAQTQDALTQWMDDSALIELSSELGLGLTYWHVMDSGRDSVDLLKKLLDRFGSRLNCVLVQNHIRGDN